jgi:predicted nucleic acid-binding protein
MGAPKVRVLLDTNVLIDGIVNHPGHETFVSSLSWAELRYGIMASADAVERASREARFDRLKATFGAGLPFDDTAAMAYGAVMR